MKNKTALLFLLTLFLLFPFPAKAYLDPGSGSYIIQVIVAAVVGSAFAVKLFFRQIKNFVLKISGKGREDKTDSLNHEK